jgi:hypothetical protein
MYETAANPFSSGHVEKVGVTIAAVLCVPLVCAISTAENCMFNFH